MTCTRLHGPAGHRFLTHALHGLYRDPPHTRDGGVDTAGVARMRQARRLAGEPCIAQSKVRREVEYIVLQRTTCA